MSGLEKLCGKSFIEKKIRDKTKNLNVVKFCIT